MDKFSDVLNLIWDFVNHPIWFPAALAVVGIIFLLSCLLKLIALLTGIVQRFNKNCQ